MDDNTREFGVFVYGTLKRGLGNHDRYGSGYLRAETATVCGRLYTLPEGFPALAVPQESIEAAGSADPLGDATLQARLDEEASRLHSLSPGAWDVVSGEYLVFDDPARRLPELDLLEGFVPGEPSLYQRVLIPVELPGNEARLAWAYIRQSEEGTYLPGGRWPETASG